MTGPSFLCLSLVLFPSISTLTCNNLPCSKWQRHAFLVQIMCREGRQGGGKTSMCSLGVNGIMVRLTHTHLMNSQFTTKWMLKVLTHRGFYFSSCKSWQINMSWLPHSLNSIQSDHWIIVYWHGIENSLLGLNPALRGFLKGFRREFWESNAQLPLAFSRVFSPSPLGSFDNSTHIM